jgi:hypothetical protein
VTTRRTLVAASALALLLSFARVALADGKPAVVVWPTLEPAGDGPSAVPLHKPQPATDRNLFERAQELDATLRDAVQDLGFTLYVADAGPAPGRTRDEDLVSRAARSATGDAPEGGTWVVSPRIEAAGGSYIVRVVAVAPRARELRVRVETVAADSVSSRGLVMLRDLLSPEAAASAAAEQEREQAAKGSAQGIMAPARSQGRAILAVNAGLFGAYAAFSVQRASGSNDPRVLYPLLALGTGIGVGAALLVADEWDVTTGDAGVISAGALWGTAAASLVAVGSNVQPIENRYGWSVGGGLLGVTLGAVAVTQKPMDDGDATLSHSGGLVGLLAGGAIEYLYRGTIANVTPYRGMGVGTAIGTIAAGAVATQVSVSPSRVLLIDVGLGSGALIGAAAASPLIAEGFPNAPPNRTRAWLSATIGGGVVGAAAAWWLTHDSHGSKQSSALPGTPSAGIIGVSETKSGATPVYGIAWSGDL